MKVGDKVKLTTLTYGEAVDDRRNKLVHIPPHKAVYIGVIKYIGPECPFPSSEIVKCTGGDVALKSNDGFSFYPKDNGEEQRVEVLEVKP